MPKVLASIACNLDSDMLLASIPLFASEKVQAIEWSFDTLYKHRNIPDWFVELLRTYSDSGRLIGHGVYFSLFSGKWSADQQAWLDRLSRLSANFNFDHITEHFGFMTGADFHKGAPLSLPFTSNVLNIGRDRLQRIAQVCQCPVGLENLAFAYTLEEVKRHGEFLNKLLEPVNGFIILDLHNLYCQLYNFEQDYEDIIQLYPLDRVREIHISGGSFEQSGIQDGKKIRRDTHDSAVPEAVFELLEKTLDRCPNLKYVVLEQLGIGLQTEDSKKQFQEDYFRMKKMLDTFNRRTTEFPNQDFNPPQKEPKTVPLEDLKLHKQQLELSAILESSESLADVNTKLRQSSLAKSPWQIENWAPEMLETAWCIARKWKAGFQ
ncbi:MAG: DUF692 domain-containing protein [Bacteroidetes bacterium]|nr:DUF692 domain-containing protein [Bacteroidota bacterium]